MSGCWVPVGTRGLPRLGGGDLLPGGSRWSAEVSKHEKSPSSGPMCHGKGRVSQQRPQFLDYSENILFQAPVKHSLNSCQEINVFNLLTVFAHIAGPLSRKTLGRPRRGLRLGFGHHLKHYQTPSKIVNGLNLLKAFRLAWPVSLVVNPIISQ